MGFMLVSWARRCGAVLLASVLAGAVAAEEGGDVAAWPGFRGVGGTGIARDADSPVSWSVKEGKNIRWKVGIEKHGMSSPLVVGNRVILTAADEDSRQVLCYDGDTGSLRWQHDVDGIEGGGEQWLPRVLEETGYASPTAATDGRFVAAVFATGELVCVNLEGERVWAKHLGVPENHYGHASSLIATEGLVLVQYDEKEKSRLLAFELATGKAAWEVARGVISWSSPVVIDNGGRREVVLVNSKAVDSYDPKTGGLLWRVECLDGEVAPSAAYADGVVFVASEGAAAVAIDVSDHAAEPKVLWRWEEALPDAASPVASGGLVIVPTAFGVVSCLDLKTGEAYWEHNFGKGFSSSPIVVGDRVYLLDMGGRMRVFRLGKAFEELGEGDVGEACYATPAFVGGRIYVRGLMQLFCIGAVD